MNSPNSVVEQVSFLDAVVGLLLEPRQTVRNLFAQRPPLYVPAFLLCLAAVVFIPIIAEMLYWDFLETRAPAVASLALVLFLTAVIFVLLEHWFLRALGDSISRKEILAAFSYSCAPLFPIIVCYYLLDLIYTGKLSIVTFVITGVVPEDQLSLSLFPFAHVLAKICFLVIFYFSLRTLRQSGPVTTLWIALISTVPFYTAFALAMFLVNICLPGSVEAIWMFLASFL